MSINRVEENFPEIQRAAMCDQIFEIPLPGVGGMLRTNPVLCFDENTFKALLITLYLISHMVHVSWANLILVFLMRMIFTKNPTDLPSFLWTLLNKL